MMMKNINAYGAILRFEERVCVRTAYNPFALIPGSATLALASTIRRTDPNVTIQADTDGQFRLRYFFDGNAGPMFPVALGPSTDPDSAILAIRPGLRSLSRGLRAAQPDIADAVDQMASYLEWTLRDTTEVIPRLDAAFAAMWRNGRAPEDPDTVSQHLKEAKNFRLAELVAKFAILRGISWRQVASRYPAGDAERGGALWSAHNDFEEAIDALDAAGTSDNTYAGTARRLREEVARDPDYAS